MSRTEEQEGFLTNERLYYSIGEVSRIVGVKPFVLRFWETEFPDIRPIKSSSNRRLYRREDIERLLVIKNLVHDQKFTIEGARRRLQEQVSSSQLDLSFLKYSGDEARREILAGLREILVLLESK
ncbi:MAG: MerR family transcriptional regulator [Myxococcota bacterium]|jgi:DNA-binding transcriptional MerR regulator